MVDDAVGQDGGARWERLRRLKPHRRGLRIGDTDGRV
jgi:hypothetical protein